MRPEKPKLAARHTRRDFLLKAANSLAKLAVANVGIYVVGSAFKSLDGSLVAGAKECYYDQGVWLGGINCDTLQMGPFPNCIGHGPSPVPDGPFGPTGCESYSTPCSCN